MTDAAVARRVADLAWRYEGRRTTRVDRCNLCESTVFVEVSREDRYGLPTVFVLCRRCGLGFLSPRLDVEEYEAFYADAYRPLVSAFHGRTIDAESVQDEQRAYADELGDFLRPRLVPPPTTLLDVGGSTGVVGGTVGASFGAAVTVLDPAPAELALAAQAGHEVIAGLAETADLAGRTWDLVLLCQTIDHLLDVRTTLETLRSLLVDEGRLFVDVLDVEFMIRRRGSVEGAVKIDHPYYLTPDTARAYFDVVGLRVEAERMAHDGHWGFVLSRGPVCEPRWDRLAVRAEELLSLAWRLRAARD